jgi:hypothetical protein
VAGYVRQRCSALPTVNGDNAQRHLLPPFASQIARAKIGTVFPGAIPNAELIDRIIDSLTPFGFNRTSSLVATALCCDEVNRPLENALRKAFGQYFNMGGLAGFAFGGVTSFGTMARRIPKGGACVRAQKCNVCACYKGFVFLLGCTIRLTFA